MKKVGMMTIALLLTIVAGAQTLNVQVGDVTYQFPAAQTGDMTYSNGTTLTIMGKEFAISDITGMVVDKSEVDASGQRCTRQHCSERRPRRGGDLYAEW